MTSIKVPKSHFTGASHVYSGGPDGLATIIRGLAIDMARVKLQSASVADFVDNSTGAAAAALVDLADSATVFNASAAGGVAYAALNTSIGKIKDAQKVITNRVNIARTLIGLTTVTVTEGNEAAAGTVPAVDKVGTAANGAGTVTYASYVAAVQVIKANQRKLERAINELLTAQGITNITIAWTGSVSSDFTL
ncbi:MAG: hypothetical protein P4L40_08345, partial [Terracidiphilus sp.]|nr:hypothetical protein [Terracidiphilus sp.]